MATYTNLVSTGFSSYGAGKCLVYENELYCPGMTEINIVHLTTKAIRKLPNTATGLGFQYTLPVHVYNNYLYVHLINNGDVHLNGSVNRLARFNLLTSTDFSLNLINSTPNQISKGITSVISNKLYYLNNTRFICCINLLDTPPYTPTVLIKTPLVNGSEIFYTTMSTYNNFLVLGARSNNENKTTGYPNFISLYDTVGNIFSSQYANTNAAYYSSATYTTYYDVYWGSAVFNKTFYTMGQMTAGNIYAFNIPTKSVSVYFRLPANPGQLALTEYNGNLYIVTPSAVNILSLPPPPTYTVPFTPTITSTISNAASQLTVYIYDPSNTVVNEVKYSYSTNGNVYADTGVAYTGATTYNFTISKNESNGNLTDISYTLYVRAVNGGSVSGNSTTANVIVYQIPRAPPTPTFTIVGSGNVQVSINESTTTPAPYYYLNNVSYYLYAYNTFGGTNLSGNTSLLVYNRPVGVLSNTNATYSPVVSYVNTGLNANTYTMYVIAQNNFGNSTPVSANIVVYTTPVSPTIDVSNTQSTTSGNLTVFIQDASNSSTNGVYYLYSMDGINYGNSGVAKTTATTYQFTINNTGNAQVPLTAGTYTLRVAASNPVGNSISSPATAPEIVYTTPVSPSIDTVNTQSTTSGNLTVFITDTVNSPINGVYYLYSMNGINYGNSGVAKTSATTYQFTINNTGNAQVPLTAGTYTLRIAAANSVGNSISSPATAIESVYTTPLAPIIDTGNTKSITSGNVNVAFTDPSNNVNNSLEYTYFMYDPSAASLFYV
jgi:hypothetical protein